MYYICYNFLVECEFDGLYFQDLKVYDIKFMNAIRLCIEDKYNKGSSLIRVEQL